jgi:glycosyltransferase involved in cell wall biosynthesis
MSTTGQQSTKLGGLRDAAEPRATAAAIERLMNDRQEADRLRAAGDRRASRFSWAKTAAGTQAAYRRTLADARD